MDYIIIIINFNLIINFIRSNFINLENYCDQS